jgi:hypothetical protein
MRLPVLAALIALAVPAVAAADTNSPWDEAAKDATRIRKLDRVVWALTATCEQGDDLNQRQCRILRDAAAAKLRGKKVIISVTGAVEIGAWDAAKKSTPITVRGCASCDGIEVDGQKWYVVTNKAAPKISGDKVVAAALLETDKAFANDALSSGWKDSAGPRLRTELILTVPADEKKAVWNRDGARGLAVEVLGYRVYDACDGSIVASEPDSQNGPSDRKTCGKDVAKPKGDTGPTEPIYDELSKDQILASLRPAVDEAKACFDTYGVAGDAKVKITIGADGSILAEEQKGDFVGTDTGKCIDAAIKKAKFPKSKKPKTTISYPVTLR